MGWVRLNRLAVCARCLVRSPLQVPRQPEIVPSKHTRGITLRHEFERTYGMRQSAGLQVQVAEILALAEVSRIDFELLLQTCYLGEALLAQEVVGEDLPVGVVFRPDLKPQISHLFKGLPAVSHSRGRHARIAWVLSRVVIGESHEYLTASGQLDGLLVAILVLPVKRPVVDAEKV